MIDGGTCYYIRNNPENDRLLAFNHRAPTRPLAASPEQGQTAENYEQ